MGKFEIIKTENSRYSSIDWENLGFGKYFSDHVFMSDYKNDRWDDGRIIPYGPMEIYPGNCTLHYAQSIFEGLKAFRDVKGGVNIFRPEKNAERLNNSAIRMCIPTYDVSTLIEAMIELVKIDKDFIPGKRGHALYLRPVVFGSSNFLGVHSSEDFRLIVITSPVASYYAAGLNPVKILVEDKFVRAAKGGVGAAKTAGNYAASLFAAKKASERGYAQVLWLDALTRELVNEVGAMNIMFVIDNELITPPLDEGTILPGITRASVLQLARDWGMKVTERGISVNEIIDTYNKGTLQEVFGTGTAAVISPVGVLAYKEKEYIINDMKIGPIAQKFYDTITGIQYGDIEDKYGWNVHFEI
ncbi:branched-chain amino acid aminotransferase [Bacteroidota bacterium]